MQPGSMRNDRQRSGSGKGRRYDSPSGNTSQSSRARDPSSIAPLPNNMSFQNVLLKVPFLELSNAFLKVKNNFAPFLGNNYDLDKIKAMRSEESLENWETIALGARTLREVGTAIIERDPHYACINKTFDDMWLFGFTRLIKLSLKMEQVANSTSMVSTVQAQRKVFLTNWIGALCKLQDTLQLYKDPESILQIIPSLENSLPPGYHASNEAARQLYKLPISYLLRDVALCLARAHSYEDKELEKVWMDRAFVLNHGISSRRYKDAYDRLRQSGRSEPTFKEEQMRLTTENKSSMAIFSGPPAPERDFADDVATVKQDYIPDPDIDNWKRKPAPIDNKDQIRSPSMEDTTSHSTSPRRESTGRVTATLNDLLVMKSFMARNSFMEGLVQGAESQGLVQPDKSDSSREHE